MKLRIARLILILLLFVLAVPGLRVSALNDSQSVYIVAVDGEITPAIASFLQDAIIAANQEGAVGILIEISTLGGRVDSAVDMRDAIFSSRLPVAVYVRDRAISAGALISIAADTLIMAPGSHIGAAEPIPNEPKILAFVSGEFRTTAEKTGRDPQIAMAMVDKSIAIEGLVDAGEILDLTANEAYQAGFSDFLASDRNEAMKIMGWENAVRVEADQNFKYQIAQFLTSYEVASILLMLGMIGLVAELFIPGFGIAGFLGVACFVLYFAGGLIAGNTEWWSVIVFIAGIILLIMEIAAPGFGVFGITGIILLLVGIVFAAPNLSQGIGTLLIAMAAAIISVPVFFRFFGRTKFARKLVLTTAETSDSGYSPAKSREDLLGKIGIAQTDLRPSGSVIIDGNRVDAVADGEFIVRGTEVQVIKVDGIKVIVKGSQSDPLN